MVWIAAIRKSDNMYATIGYRMCSSANLDQQTHQYPPYNALPIIPPGARATFFRTLPLTRPRQARAPLPQGALLLQGLGPIIGLPPHEGSARER